MPFLLERMNGQLWVLAVIFAKVKEMSQSLQGTHFTVFLPTSEFEFSNENLNPLL